MAGNGARQDGARQEAFQPMRRVVGSEGNVYRGFDEYVDALPKRNSYIIPDGRFARFVSILRGEEQQDKQREQRDRERLFNPKELGPKLDDGSHVPPGRWELYNDFDARTGDPKVRPKRRNNVTGGLQAMVPASEIEAVIWRAHALGGHKGLAKTWADIQGAYAGIPQALVKVFVRNCSCSQRKASAMPVKRKRAGLAQASPAAWFRVQADLMSMADQPCLWKGRRWQYILQAVDHRTGFTLLAPLQRKTAEEVAENLYRWFCEHGPPQILHTDNGGEFAGWALIDALREHWPSLRLVMGQSRAPWTQGAVEQAHQTVYSLLRELREQEPDPSAVCWAEKLPLVAYMMNTSVQSGKAESPLFQRDGRESRLGNADSLVTAEPINEEEYRRFFDANFGLRYG